MAEGDSVIEDLLTDAQDAFFSGDTERAATVCKDALKKYPKEEGLYVAYAHESHTNILPQLHAAVHRAYAD